MESDPGSANDAGAERHFGRWEFERLAEFARRGSLAAGRELIRRATIQLELACSQRPDLIEPDLGDWLRNLLGKALNNPRQPIGQLMAPRSARTERPRPKTHAELLYDLSLTQEAYIRVRRAVAAGAQLKTVFHTVAVELSALGYRNSKHEPLRGSSIRDRYYAVRREETRLRRR
jgi:hypothetical protein